ncbi:hypothetical protein J6G99_08855 [bacterium]|nr:hypothetical protein [bacterium]
MNIQKISMINNHNQIFTGDKKAKRNNNLHRTAEIADLYAMESRIKENQLLLTQKQNQAIATVLRHLLVNTARYTDDQKDSAIECINNNLYFNKNV